MAVTFIHRYLAATKCEAPTRKVPTKRGREMASECSHMDQIRDVKPRTRGC